MTAALVATIAVLWVLGGVQLYYGLLALELIRPGFSTALICAVFWPVAALHVLLQ